MFSNTSFHADSVCSVTSKASEASNATRNTPGRKKQLTLENFVRPKPQSPDTKRARLMDEQAQRVRHLEKELAIERAQIARLKGELNESIQQRQQRDAQFSVSIDQDRRRVTETIALRYELELERLRKTEQRLGTVVRRSTGVSLAGGDIEAEIADNIKKINALIDQTMIEQAALQNTIKKVTKDQDDAGASRRVVMSIKDALSRELRDLKNRLAGEEKRREGLARERTANLPWIRRMKLYTARGDGTLLPGVSIVEDGGRREYIIKEILGKGGECVVYLAYDLYGRRDVACKIHQLPVNDGVGEGDLSEEIERRRGELRAWVDLTHDPGPPDDRAPRDEHQLVIVPLYTVFGMNGSTDLVVVMKHCAGGDLDLRIKTDGAMTEGLARVMFRQILEALVALHGKGIVHYDLKPANILFEREYGSRLFVADFGLSKQIKPDQDHYTMRNDIDFGTYYYLPPECLMQQPHVGTAVDIWSVGCILYEMLTGSRPFGRSVSQPDYRASIQAQSAEISISPGLTAAQMSSIDALCGKQKPSKAAKDFLLRMLANRPDDRPTADELLEDGWFGTKGGADKAG